MPEEWRNPRGHQPGWPPRNAGMERANGPRSLGGIRPGQARTTRPTGMARRGSPGVAGQGRGWVTVGEPPSPPSRSSFRPIRTHSPALPTPRTAGQLLVEPLSDSAMSLGLVLLLASGVLLMVGSVTTWIHASTSFGNFFHLSVSVNGLDSATSSPVRHQRVRHVSLRGRDRRLGWRVDGSRRSSLRSSRWLAGLTSLGFAVYFVVQGGAEDQLRHRATGTRPSALA